MGFGKLYGYARVSSKSQNEERQIIALREFGIEARDIYCDKQSGKDFDRPEYQKLLHLLQAGDVLVVKSIDRLGRNYNEILCQWRILTRACLKNCETCSKSTKLQWRQGGRRPGMRHPACRIW